MLIGCSSPRPHGLGYVVPPCGLVGPPAVTGTLPIAPVYLLTVRQRNHYNLIKLVRYLSMALVIDNPEIDPIETEIDLATVSLSFEDASAEEILRWAVRTYGEGL